MLRRRRRADGVLFYEEVDTSECLDPPHIRIERAAWRRRVIRRLREEGLRTAEIARVLSIGTASVYRLSKVK